MGYFLCPIIATASMYMLYVGPEHPPTLTSSNQMQTITMRAARGLLESKLITPQAISPAPLEDEVEALHSEGNVQRGKSL